MNFEILISNLTNPTLLFFILGLFATFIKSDLEIPAPTFKFLSIYLLFSIGFKGGVEFSKEPLSLELMTTMGAGLLLSVIIPIFVFYFFRKKVGVSNAGAIAATYGSVSAVTFVSAVSFLEFQNISFSGYMVAVMAAMEAPAIIVGVFLINKYEDEKNNKDMLHLIKHSFTNGSVLIILGSLFIGAISNADQANGIKPFTTDIFKGFLSIFLLEMGIQTARSVKNVFKYGAVIPLFSIVFPLVVGSSIAYFSHSIVSDLGNRFILAVLAASASYIAVPASMRLVAPKSDSGLYVSMALGLTFPINITIGLPLFLQLAK